MHLVHKATALTWARRAIAYRGAAERASGELKTKRLQAFDDARHESLEHAALAEDDCKTLRRVMRMIDGPRGKR
jgi:hypothetical protein